MRARDTSRRTWPTRGADATGIDLSPAMVDRGPPTLPGSDVRGRRPATPGRSCHEPRVGGRPGVVLADPPGGLRAARRGRGPGPSTRPGRLAGPRAARRHRGPPPRRVVRPGRRPRLRAARAGVVVRSSRRRDSSTSSGTCADASLRGRRPRIVCTSSAASPASTATAAAPPRTAKPRRECATPTTTNPGPQAATPTSRPGGSSAPTTTDGSTTRRTRPDTCPAARSASTGEREPAFCWRVGGWPAVVGWRVPRSLGVGR